MNFNTAAAAANPAFYNTFGETVTVSRTGSTSFTMTAIREDESARGQDAAGFMVKVVDVGFVCKAADYTYGAPAHGDKITDAAGRVYDVQVDGVQKIPETVELKIPVAEVL
jgi:hypothetical protein